MASNSTQQQPNFGERFFKYFQHELAALQEQMTRLPHTSPSGGERTDAINHCLAGIARLSNEVQDASQQLPAYDQRTYGEAVKALGEKLQTIRDGLAPKPKFTFRGQLKTRGRGTAAKTVTAVVESNSHGSGRINGVEEKNDEDPALVEINAALKKETHVVHQPNFSNASRVALFDQSNMRVWLPESSAPPGSSSVLRNLQACVVDLSHASPSSSPLSGLTLKDISRCIIVSGALSGPIHITNVKNSILVVTCGQFRMHECKDVDIYLHCGSNPIVEDVDDVRFTPLPDAYLNEDLKRVKNMWNHVDDFKWLKAEPSPHWTTLSESRQLDASFWTVKMRDDESSVEDLLHEAKI